MTVSVQLPDRKRKPKAWKILYNGSEEPVLSKRCHLVIETDWWDVLIFPDLIKVGCKKFSYDQWMNFYEEITVWDNDYASLVSYFQGMGEFKTFANKVFEYWNHYGSKLKTRLNSIKSPYQRKITEFIGAIP